MWCTIQLQLRGLWWDWPPKPLFKRRSIKVDESPSKFDGEMNNNDLSYQPLTHWGRVTYICVIKSTIIGSDNGLSPGRRQANIWTSAGLLFIGNLGTNFSEILIEIHTFSFKKIRLKTSSAKWRPCCVGLNELMWRQSWKISMINGPFEWCHLQYKGRRLGCTDVSK